MKVPFHDLSREYQKHYALFTERFQDVLKSGWYILGSEVSDFEQALAEYTGSNYCVGVASGTDAITLSLMAAGLGSGDEIITTDVTAFPTITAINRAGCTPVPVDINLETGLIDAHSIEAAIGPATKAIIPVHLYGQSCDMDAITAVANKNSLLVIEDCAQSIAATYHNKHTGTFGLTGCFSFYPTKNLGCLGDGGAITTDSKEIYESLLQLRNYGQTDRYTHTIQGLNSRLDELQAAILNTKLEFLDQQIKRRNQIVQYYQANIKTLEFVKEESYGRSSHHLCVLKSEQRETLRTSLEKRGIATLIHYPIPVHQQQAFQQFSDQQYPNADVFTSEVFSIPCFPELEDDEIEYVVSCLNHES